MSSVSLDAMNVGKIFVEFAISSKTSRYWESNICSDSFRFMLYLLERAVTMSSHDFGILFFSMLSLCLLIVIGSMSVSGYILAAPALGLENTVLPSTVAARVSAGTPYGSILKLLIIASMGKTTLCI